MGNNKEVSSKICFKSMRSDHVCRHMKIHIIHTLENNEQMYHEHLDEVLEPEKHSFTTKRKYNEDMHEKDEGKDISDVRGVNGNFIIHKEGCICCRRMANGVSKYTSTVTEESYKIDGDYTCETNNCIYLVTCGICDAQYVGKTTKWYKNK